MKEILVLVMCGELDDPEPGRGSLPDRFGDLQGLRVKLIARDELEWA